MSLIETSELIKTAMARSSLNQSEFAKEIGKSQAQVSKYLAGSSIPNKDTFIRIMNIIASYQPDQISHIDILIQMNNLDSVRDHELFVALLGMIKAYKSASHCDA